MADALSRHEPLPTSQYFLLIIHLLVFLILIIENTTLPKLQALPNELTLLQVLTVTSEAPLYYTGKLYLSKHQQ